MQPDTFIYTLGNGWAPWEDIPKEQRSPSILACAVSSEKDVFLPKLLFDGTLKREFYDLYAWHTQLTPLNDSVRMFRIDMTLPRIGVVYTDVLKHPQRFAEISMTNKIRAQFDFFESWSFYQIFVLDVRRMGKMCTNSQLLDFEDLVRGKGYDLRNFIYVSNTGVCKPDMFDGCRAKTIIYKDDGWQFKAQSEFRNTRRLFAEDISYINARIDRIKAELANRGAR